MEIRDTRYAKTSDGAYVAYQTVGEGPIDVGWQFDAVGNVDLVWEWPGSGRWLRGLAGFCRVILHDRAPPDSERRTILPADDRPGG